MKSQPACSNRAARSTHSVGDIAFRSAKTAGADAVFNTAAATADAAPGGQTLITMSLTATTSAIAGSTSRSPASDRVRWDRPSSVVTTRAPLDAHALPSAEPIAPGEAIPIVVTTTSGSRQVSILDLARG